MDPARDTIMLLANNARGLAFGSLNRGGSTAGYMPFSAMERDSTVVASKWAKEVAGAGSVKSSAGT